MILLTFCQNKADLNNFVGFIINSQIETFGVSLFYRPPEVWRVNGEMCNIYQAAIVVVDWKWRIEASCC
jgi:hypothetical protein